MHKHAHTHTHTQTHAHTHTRIHRQMHTHTHTRVTHTECRGSQIYKRDYPYPFSLSRPNVQLRQCWPVKNGTASSNYYVNKSTQLKESNGTRNCCYYGEIWKRRRRKKERKKERRNRVKGATEENHWHGHWTKYCNLAINVLLNFDRYLPLSRFVLGPLDWCKFCLWCVWVEKSKSDFEERVFNIAMGSMLYVDLVVHVFLNTFIFLVKIRV
jgi:hypothetical protein